MTTTAATAASSAAISFFLTKKYCSKVFGEMIEKYIELEGALERRRQDFFQIFPESDEIFDRLEKIRPSDRVEEKLDEKNIAFIQNFGAVNNIAKLASLTRANFLESTNSFEKRSELLLAPLKSLFNSTSMTIEAEFNNLSRDKIAAQTAFEFLELLYNNVLYVMSLRRVM
jgi:hypothetical protein